MSFDMFVQPFCDGNAKPMPAEAFLKIFGQSILAAIRSGRRSGRHLRPDHR
jgi:hypothetical protein